MDALAGPVFRDDSRLGEVHFARDFFYQRFGTRNNRSDLKRALEESLKEQGAHRKGGNSRLPLSPCPVAIYADDVVAIPANGSLDGSLSYARVGKNLNEALTLTIKVIIVSQAKKTCPLWRKLLFCSHAQPFDGQRNGQISPDPVADCLLPRAARPASRHPDRRPLAHQKGVARQGYFEGRQVGPTDGSGGR